MRNNCKSTVTFRLTGCLSSEFQCGSGECISLSSRCNRRVECHDGSDEDGCREYPIVTSFVRIYIATGNVDEIKLLLKCPVH